MALADRATIANMAPEYGATCGFFPIDKETIRFLNLTGRDAERIKLVEAYAKAQGMWRDDSTPDPVFTDSACRSTSARCRALAGRSAPSAGQGAALRRGRPLSSANSSKFGVPDGEVNKRVASRG